MPSKYYAFISYSHKDSDWAKWLQHELEYYQLPSTLNGREGLPSSFRPVFRDEDELSGGELKSQISRALADSEFLIVICSPNSAKSGYVNNEIKEFIEIGKTRNEDYTKRIFPLIVEGKPHQKEGSQIECFPRVLNELKDIDGNKIELIAGDIIATGRNHAFVKILAGTLQAKNVQFSELWNRYEEFKLEEEKRQKENLNRYFRMSSRFVAEKLKGFIYDGNISFAARGIGHMIANNESQLYIDEIDQTVRSILTNKYCRLQPPENFDNLSHNLSYGDISPDGTVIASMQNKQLYLYSIHDTYLTDRISLNHFVKARADYVCYVNDKVIAFVEKPIMDINVDDDFSMEWTNLIINVINIENREIVSKHYYNVESIKWIDHEIVNGELYFEISDGSHLHLINAMRGSFKTIPLVVSNAKCICFVTPDNLLQLEPDAKNNVLSINEISLQNISTRAIANKKFPHLSTYMGINKQSRERKFIFAGSRIYEIVPTTDSISLVHKITKNIISIDYNDYLKSIAILTPDSIELLSKMGHRRWKQDSFMTKRTYDKDNIVRWVGNSNEVAVFGKTEQGIDLILLEKNYLDKNIISDEDDTISFIRITYNNIIIVTTKGVVIIVESDSLVEVSRFPTYLKSIYDATVIDNKIHITSATEKYYKVKYSIRKAFRNGVCGIISVWTLDGELLHVHEPDVDALDDSIFSSDTFQLTVSSGDSNLQNLEIKEYATIPLWERNDLNGSISKISGTNNYVLFLSFDESMLWILDRQTGNTVATFSQENNEMVNPTSYFIVCADISSDESLISIGYSNGAIIIYNINDGRVLKEFNFNAFPKKMAFTPDCHYLYIA